MDIDEVLINLKVLEQLQVNQKLISRGPYLNIEFSSIVPEWVRRWKRQDNRNETIKKINIVINSAFRLREKNPEIDKYLKTTVQGLKSLKETYATCCQTTARIDVLINKINGISVNIDINDEDLKKKLM